MLSWSNPPSAPSGGIPDRRSIVTAIALDPANPAGVAIAFVLLGPVPYAVPDELQGED